MSPRSVQRALSVVWLMAGVGCSSASDTEQGTPGPDQDAEASADVSAEVPADVRKDAVFDGTGDVEARGDALSEDGPVEPLTRTRYPAGERHSPMSPYVVDRVKAVLDATSGKKDVFAKVGDSITVSTYFLGCFAGTDIQWDAYSALESSRAWFDQTKVDGAHTSFDRPSLAAKVGWSAKAALTGSPTPIDQELNAIQPAFAVIMFGTNDTYDTGVHPFEHALMADIDALLSKNAVPLLSTIPPRGDDPGASALVPEMNAIIRAVAQARQVPVMDFWQLLADLPDYGLAGDGVHPQVYVSGAAHGCWFTTEALQKGVNARNLITMEALDRARRFLIDGQAPEPAPPSLSGKGTLDAPWIIPELPFVDDADTASGSKNLAGYACNPADETGPEHVYELTIDTHKKLRARVFCDDGVDIDLHWMSGKAADQCIARADRDLDIDAAPGTYFLVADSYVDKGAALSGKYRLTIVEVP